MGPPLKLNSLKKGLKTSPLSSNPPDVAGCRRTDHNIYKIAKVLGDDENILSV